MGTEKLDKVCAACLRKLCRDISDRSVGSEGNRAATDYFKQELVSLGWDAEVQEFDAFDWESGGAELRVCGGPGAGGALLSSGGGPSNSVGTDPSPAGPEPRPGNTSPSPDITASSPGGTSFEVLVSPYSPGCSVQARLECASSIEELRQVDMQGKILLLHGPLAREQLMPKNFVFYNPEEHRTIISLLESGRPQAIVCATSRNPALAGGVYPFPLIEDGDFDIPSVYMTEKEGIRLARFEGKEAALTSVSHRIPGRGYNVIGRKGNAAGGRIVVTAHIDAKKGTPGAIDNATGVTVLLLVARLLSDYSGTRLVELAALNGEDYYSVPGHMVYIERTRFDTIVLNINIDGAGYREGETAFSFYNIPVELKSKIKGVLGRFSGIIEGAQWPQGDHSIFVQFGRPAIAVTSRWFSENMESQNITHTPADDLDIVDCGKVVETAEVISSVVDAL